MPMMTLSLRPRMNMSSSVTNTDAMDSPLDSLGGRIIVTK